MINGVSTCYGAISPARFIRTDTQLVYGGMGSRHTLGNTIFSKILTNITHFANCFMQCRQNTVVSLMGSIQHCILFSLEKLVGFLENLRTSNACCQGIIHAEKNVRNNHEYLTKIKESDENLQCLDQYSMIEADMFYNFNDVKKRKTTITHQGENTIIFKIISGITTVLFLQRPTIFLN